ncbi:MAG: threonine--tRNA ligase [Halobacteriovoraceae bacterium]|nr:threonine--tRNA ligase [Halobacteriovoraceae bacterium]|tara:strand:- start:11231 stop:12988 length:1758 start_codon:yes stop_codon:yes gene_type:complete
MAKFDLEVIRHSTAHLMAQAIQELYPDENVKLGIGPTIENGFYYDIDMEKKIHEEDLKTIETKMKEIIKRSDEITRFEVSRGKALEIFEEAGQEYKVELIKDLPEGETISYYTQGDTFIDLCRGPHVETTRQLPMFFKLLHTAGAYWRGDETRPMLQRVYAACFDDKKKLKEHLNFLEEAKKRDHRKLGKELGLFLFDQSAPGSPFFEPKGTIVYNELIAFIRKIYQIYDYKEVITPQVLDVELWKTSGHWDNYKDDMFFTNDDHREMAVKPMNCPCHMLMFKHKKYSYRDLPLRYADFGRLHRNERSGALAGVTRVRTFCQDDAHVFLSKDDIQKEVTSLLDMFNVCYDHFGFKNIKIGLSTRPEKKVGDDATWDLAESALKGALDASKYDYFINEGDGAFYGPKIDIQISDAIGRYHQLGTVQLDFQLPERFDLKFTNSNGEDERPVVIHRALLGSLERFFGVYLEHVAGAFPFWLAPEQVVFVPVNNEIHGEYCQELAAQLRQQGLRARVDDSNETMGKKTRTLQKAKVPFMAVIGDKEIEAKSLALRSYGSKETNVYSLEEAMDKFRELNNQRFPKQLREL